MSGETTPGHREGFIEWMTVKKLKPRTIKEYIYYFDKFNFDFTQERIISFLNRYNNIIARAFITNYMKYRGIHGIEIPRITGQEKVRLMKIVTKDQVGMIENHMQRERDKLMLLVSFYAGLRLGGLMRIKIFDFQWEKWWINRSKGGELHVIEKGDKERVVLLPGWLMTRIETWIREVISPTRPDAKKPLFRLCSRSWNTNLGIASVKALGFRIHPHTLRHSYATYLINRNVPIHIVKELMGHSSVSITEIYIHQDKEKIKEIYDTAIMGSESSSAEASS